MILLKCKMCGGDIDANLEQTIGTCDSCGSTMTLPKVSDERIANLYNRANHYRQQNEFDKALATYENILAESNIEAEAHWGVVLSKFGIEYIEDPATHKRVPTCHRVQNESILVDLDYKAALANAINDQTKQQYIKEAMAIAEIQKSILEIANNESPYDVFICYKETDEKGERTKDSVIAQDIYFQLAEEGYKVFFSRITLEDKLGQQYEPYIFAALNSAKVMVVLGTKPEHFNAVWVKNEWSRYIELLKKDRNRLLIPCYSDVDAYDIPDELSAFQSQDMSKVGFMQDILRGIKKVLDTGKGTEVKQTDTQTVLQAAPLLRRAFLVLEDQDWNKADELLEQVLNQDPENARAYVGKLCVALKVSTEEELANKPSPMTNMPNYQKALRFADAELHSLLEQYNQSAIKLKTEQDESARKKEVERKLFAEKQAKKRKIYDIAKKSMGEAFEYKGALYHEDCRSTEFSTALEKLIFAAEQFETINTLFDDASALANRCNERASHMKRQKERCEKFLCIYCGGAVAYWSGKCKVCGKKSRF